MNPSYKTSALGLRFVFVTGLVSVLLTAMSGCSGSGTPAAAPVLSATLSVGTVTFPSVMVGASATSGTPVVLTNTGTGALTISGVTVGGTNATVFGTTGNTCSGTLAVGAACSFSVTFSPVGSGSFSGQVSVADNATSSPQVVTVTGVGTSSAVVLTPKSVTFPGTVIGSVGSTQTVVLSSSGTTALHITGVTIGGGATSDFTVTGNTCGTTLAAASNCSITVTFGPEAVKSYSDTLNVADDATNSPQSVGLSGAGTAVPSPASCKAPMVTSPAQPTPTSNYAGTAFSGSVKAGSVGVIGATVQVYAAGTTGNGSNPTGLLAVPAVTDGNGNFSVPVGFVCPLSNTVLYAVATGGKAGSGGTLNPGTVLMSVLGVCSKLTSGASYTINEATTVSSAYAMNQFLTTGAKIGASATNASGLALAAGTAANLVNVTTGAMPGTYFPATGTAPSAKIGSVANLLNACVVGGAASTACTGLYAATAVTTGTTTVTPTNTLDAVANLVKQPGTNVTTLYTLSGGSTAYATALTAAPADWTLYVTFAGGGMNDPTAVSIDSTGLVWVANYFGVTSLFSNTGTAVAAGGLLPGYTNESYGAAVSVNDVFWEADEQTAFSQNNGNGGITLVNNQGSYLGMYTAGGIYFPTGISFDTSGDAWVTAYGDTNAGVVVLNSAGSPISGALGFGSAQFDFPVATATDLNCNAFLANQSSNTITKVSLDGSSFTSFPVGSGPSGLAVDESNNAWSANYYGDSVGLMYGTTGVPKGNSGFKGGGISHPQGIAVDGLGNVWVANYRGPALSELAGVMNAKAAGTVLSPSAGWAPDANMIESFSLAIDASGNLWISNFGTNTLTEFVGLAAPVKTPLLGPVRVP